jgi:hypothetical protein
MAVHGATWEPIPSGDALRLCDEIRRTNQKRWWPPNGLWCWGCASFSSASDRRGWANAAGNRGCALLNARYDLQVGEVSTTGAESE